MEDTLNIETFYPSIESLKKHIVYYYIIKTDSEGFSKTWYSFPHIDNALSIYKHVGFKTTQEAVYINGNVQNGYTTLLQGKIQKPLLVDVAGRINRITIIFKPLGLNCFIKRPLGNYISPETKEFTDWEGTASYNALMKNLFDDQIDNIHRIKLLETFLLSLYKPFFNHELEKAIAFLTNFEDELTVQETAHSVHMNLRSFNRFFIQYVGIPPSVFKQIARFRHSINNKLHSQTFEKLTAIAYESNFYDQSYFNRIYKKLAGTNPGTFFKKIEKMSDNNLILQFVNSLDCPKNTI